DSAARSQKLDGKPKFRASSRYTTGADVTVHHVDQTLTYSQAEPGTTEFSCRGRIGLREGLEQSGLLLRRHSHAIVKNNETHLKFGRRLSNQVGSQFDFAAAGEFNSVAEQVQ